MKFVIIDPKARTVTTVDHKELKQALLAAGLDPGAVDHGSLGRGVGYVVFEYGMFTPATAQHYFSLNRKLIAGPCVIYGYDEMGETVDAMELTASNVRFYRNANDVEAAIESDEIKRPEMRANGALIWAWPMSPPPGMDA